MAKSTAAWAEVGPGYRETEEHGDGETGERGCENAKRRVGRQFEEG